jgi:general secretion pathway protein A
MYEKYYGLKERAFNLTPDPSFLYLNKRSRDALNQILYGIERREGFCLIVGDVGTGKTTLSRCLLERLHQKNIRTALIQNPMLSATDILKSIIQDLGVRPELSQVSDNTNNDNGLDAFDSSWMQGMGKKELIDRLNSFLAERAQENIFTVLIIDEAQDLSMELLEQLRLLSNLETAKKKLLQILFIGQLELYKKLRSPLLRQLNQRISVSFETRSLSKGDTERYVRYRLAAAGGAPNLRFGRGVFRAVWKHSRGYPRLINLVCDRSLLAGYNMGVNVITSKIVHKAAFGLRGKETIKLRILPGWFWRRIPLIVPTILLLFVLLFVVWKSLISKIWHLFL